MLLTANRRLWTKWWQTISELNLLITSCKWNCYLLLMVPKFKTFHFHYTLRPWWEQLTLPSWQRQCSWRKQQPCLSAGAVRRVVNTFFLVTHRCCQGHPVIIRHLQKEITATWHWGLGLCVVLCQYRNCHAPIKYNRNHSCGSNSRWEQVIGPNL